MSEQKEHFLSNTPLLMKRQQNDLRNKIRTRPNIFPGCVLLRQYQYLNFEYQCYQGEYHNMAMVTYDCTFFNLLYVSCEINCLYF